MCFFAIQTTFDHVLASKAQSGFNYSLCLNLIVVLRFTATTNDRRSAHLHTLTHALTRQKRHKLFVLVIPDTKRHLDFGYQSFLSTQLLLNTHYYIIKYIPTISKTDVVAGV